MKNLMILASLLISVSAYSNNHDEHHCKDGKDEHGKACHEEHKK